MEKAVEVAIEKINEMKLEIEKSFEYKRDLLSEKRLKAQNKEIEVANKENELIETSHEKHKKANAIYLEVISFSYKRWLEEENSAYKEVFDKFKRKINLGMYWSLNSLLDPIEELVKVKKQIKNLEREINEYENLSDDEQWIEDLKTLSESHLIAIDNCKDWHQRDLSFKVVKRLEELGVGSSENQYLIEEN